MLKIKKCRSKREEYIVYDVNNFEHHTHTKHLRVALKLKYLCNNKILPTSKDVRFVESLIRLTNDRRYKQKLETYLNELKGCKL